MPTYLYLSFDYLQYLYAFWASRL